ncbi:FecR family protein [Flavihumibacter petaseus]|uniref:Putative anti-sigma factor n=1 Tax=Flavihumibacter petaseus NBRC 106054 TaxID=1220578 RepID=A0A0E9MZZ5_9BACT|nr:FecR family protein [Flavihumibacter petaseus]GAO42700.1 putative anti-sigma factor [Flavihumibacter petaseus NBRC 106054]
MNEYAPKSAADLLADESFLLYCSGDEKATAIWEQQLQLDPALREVAAEAKRLHNLVKAELTDAGAATRSFKTLLPPAAIPLYKNRNLLRQPWTRIAAAIILLAVAGGGMRLLMKDKTEQPQPEQSITKSKPAESDAMPGSNIATLVLADGSSVVLDSAANGEIASQGNSRIIKLPNDQIRYETAASSASIGFNTILTPKGGQYKLVLPDGTGVWLNAASSLKYPTAFTGRERRVTVTGEVYFEVAKMNNRMPFVVEKDGLEIRVLGTHFNVNTYADEPQFKITLLEGSVAIRNKSMANPIVLVPGQQARFAGENGSGSNTGKPELLSDVDVEEVMAWKNGRFDFSNADIQTIMRQIARWYDLEVVFKGTVPQRQFAGKITRNTNLSNVLKILEQSNIHFEVENRTIVVKP